MAEDEEPRYDGPLSKVVLENFKTFKNTHELFFHQYTAIVDHESNKNIKTEVVEAIAFVLNDDLTNLRVEEYSELINGALNGNPTSNTCSVTLFLKNDEGTPYTLKKIVKDNAVESYVDGVLVPEADYADELEKNDFYITVRNFIVNPTKADQLPVMNISKITWVFEVISGSLTFKPEYDILVEQRENLDDYALGEFERIKQSRCQLFNDLFETVSTNIERFYQYFTDNLDARASVTLENPEEPYLGKIDFNYHCPPTPNKRRNRKTMKADELIAALALLFTLQLHDRSPFFLLGSVDKLLNAEQSIVVSKMLRYLSESKVQVISAASKCCFFCQATHLIGIKMLPGPENNLWMHNYCCLKAQERIELARRAELQTE